MNHVEGLRGQYLSDTETTELNAAQHELFVESFLKKLHHQMRRRTSGGKCSNNLGRLLLDKFRLDPGKDSLALRRQIEKSAEEIGADMLKLFALVDAA